MSLDTSSPILLSSGNGYSEGNLKYKGYGIYEYPLPSGINLPEDSYIAVNSLQIPYSWQNINSAYNNNTFSYTIQSGAGTSTPLTRSFTIASGNYSYTELNEYLQRIMYNNKDYLIDAQGEPVYYLSFQVNAPLYKITFTCVPLPTSLGTLTKPSGSDLYIGLDGGYGFTFTIPNTNSVKLFGLTAGIYPPTAQTSLTYVSSDQNPIISPITSVIVNCNLCNNQGLTIQQNAIFNFNPTVGSIYGSILNPIIYNLSWYKAGNGYFQNITFQITDGVGQYIELIDSSSFLIELKILKNKK